MSFPAIVTDPDETRIGDDGLRWVGNSVSNLVEDFGRLPIHTFPRGLLGTARVLQRDINALRNGLDTLHELPALDMAWKVIEVTDLYNRVDAMRAQVSLALRAGISRPPAERTTVLSGFEPEDCAEPPPVYPFRG